MHQNIAAVICHDHITAVRAGRDLIDHVKHGLQLQAHTDHTRSAIFTGKLSGDRHHHAAVVIGFTVNLSIGSQRLRIPRITGIVPVFSQFKPAAIQKSAVRKRREHIRCSLIRTQQPLQIIHHCVFVDRIQRFHVHHCGINHRRLLGEPCLNRRCIISGRRLRLHIIQLIEPITCPDQNT